jgi:hypothetical protein
MLRVTVFLVLLAYGSSMSLSGSGAQMSANTNPIDASDVVDNDGAGYSYFRKQDVGVRPSMRATMPVSTEDISEYQRSSALSKRPVQSQVISSNSNQMLNRAFGQQQLMPRANLPVQTLVPKTIQRLQPIARQNDLSLVQNSFNGEQSNLLSENVLNNQAQDFQTIGSQQVLLPRTNLNVPQTTLISQRNQQQLLSIPQQSSWSAQQSFDDSGSSFSQQIQRPMVSSNFASQPTQQAIAQPVVNTGLRFPQVPLRRVIAQSQSSPTVSNGGW